MKKPLSNLTKSHIISFMSFTKDSLYKILAAVWCIFLMCHSASAQVFQRITSTGQLKTTSEYIIVCEDVSGVMTNVSNGSNKLKNETITITNNLVALPSGSNAAVFVLGGSSNSYTFMNGTKYLAHSSSNNLDFVTSSTDGKWKVSFNGNDVRLKKTTAADRVMKSIGGDYYGYYNSGAEVQLYKKTDAASSVTITTAKYATFSNTNTHDFSLTGIKAYTATCSGNTVRLHEITNGIVPANTGVVLFKDVAASETIGVPYTDSSADALPDNDLLVSDGTIVSDGATYFALANKTDGIGFYLVGNGVTIPSGKPYLKVDVAEIREFIAFDESNQMGISHISTMSNKDAYYNLQGIRSAQPEKGVYINKGKKIIIR